MYDLNYVFRSRDKLKKMKQNKTKQKTVKNTQINLCLFINYAFLFLDSWKVITVSVFVYIAKQV